MTEHEVACMRALQRLDQEDPIMERRLDMLINGVRGDLEESHDKMRTIAVHAVGAAEQGIAHSATMLAYALVRLARQDPAR